MIRGKSCWTWADADIDQVMKRTARRPLARHAVPTRHALIFGLVMGVASFVKLFHLSNTYLSLLFVGIAVDSVLSLPTLF